MSFQDRTLTCVDCGASFTFSADDQQYHREKGYTNEPKRCPNCRQARRSSNYGGGSSYGGGGGGYERAPRQMFDAVCSNCGKETQVPFQPRGDKPVYCSDCFAEKRQSSGYGSYSRDRY